VDAVLERLDVSPENGLEEGAVRERRRRCGANQLQEKKRRPAAAILLDQMKNLIVLLLALAASAAAVFTQWLEAAAILVAIGLNIVFGFVTELRATRSMEALRRMGRVSAKVRRGGQLFEIDAREVVPGDIVVLESGDIVTADLRLLEASRLEADESALTGESIPVPKQVAPVADTADLSRRASMLYKGTSITHGSGHGVAVHTGMQTELGRIASLAAAAEARETPLEKRLSRLGYRLIWLTLAIAVVVVLTGIAAGKELFLLMETAIALAVAAAPEGLPVVASIALARGMWRMLAHNALLNRLSAVETLGSTTTICTDKTGTLTENKMRVSEIHLPPSTGDAVETIAPDEAAPSGFQKKGRAVEAADHPAFTTLVQTVVLCNNAGLAAPGDEAGEAVGDPMEIALLQLGRKADVERKALLQHFPETREVAFDQKNKMMATFHRENGRLRVAVKGAPEQVLAACSTAGSLEQPHPFGEEQRRGWRERNRRMAENGLRVLAAAAKYTDNDGGDPYAELCFSGLIGMQDPPRCDVAPAIDECRRAGVKVVMVTGDQPTTAVHVANAVGLVQTDSPAVLQGNELPRADDLSSAQRRQRLQTDIFARVSPEQKLDLVALYQENGHVVAMTGDGVNDAPALKKADIGIAMGRRGTQVAREAADMVLQDDAFKTIVVAIAQGRAIFDNIRKFILFLLSGNVGEIMIVGFAISIGSTLPLLPLQILYLNMIGDVFPALALALGQGDPTRMQRPPRDPAEPILTRRHWTAIGAYGLLIAATVLGAFYLAQYWFGADSERAVTVSFLCLSFSRLWHVFNMRHAASGIFDNDIVRNAAVWGALVVCTALLLAATYAPGLSGVLNLVHPGSKGWILILGFSLLPLIIGQAALAGYKCKKS